MIAMKSQRGRNIVGISGIHLAHYSADARHDGDEEVRSFSGIKTSGIVCHIQVNHQFDILILLSFSS
jgi:hypothetical protein